MVPAAIPRACYGNRRCWQQWYRDGHFFRAYARRGARLATGLRHSPNSPLPDAVTLHALGEGQPQGYRAKEAARLWCRFANARYLVVLSLLLSDLWRLCRLGRISE